MTDRISRTVEAPTTGAYGAIAFIVEQGDRPGLIDIYIKWGKEHANSYVCDVQHAIELSDALRYVASGPLTRLAMDAAGE